MLHLFRRPSLREQVAPLVRGRARLSSVRETRAWAHNDILYGWASVVGQLLTGAPDGKPYKIGAMYIEFENNGGVAVSAPSFTRADGLDYYSGLSVSSVRDYLRVPLIAATLSSSDETNFPGGNVTTFYAQTAGTAGVHGKAFNDSVQSRVYGAALVATPEFSDASQDIVYSRLYFPSAEQLIKLIGSQLAVSWEQQYG